MGTRPVRGKVFTKSLRSREERDALVLEHLGTARRTVSVLWGFPSVRRLGWDEAYSTALLALVEAAGAWPDDRGSLFIHYAEARCRNAILWRVYQLRQERSALSIYAEEVAARPDYDSAEHDRLEEERVRLDALLNEMPDGPERVYLQARLENLSQFDAWDRAGRPGKWGRHYEWEQRSIRLLKQCYDNTTKGGSGNAA